MGSNAAKGAPGEVMRRVLATEAAARRAEEEARREAADTLERARADARAIEARAVERIRRVHERAEAANERLCQELWQDARNRLQALEAAAPGEREWRGAAARVAERLTRSDGNRQPDECST